MIADYIEKTHMRSRRVDRVLRLVNTARNTAVSCSCCLLPLHGAARATIMLQYTLLIIRFPVTYTNKCCSM